MLLGVLGDVHGAFEALDRVMALEPDVPIWLCVGDVGSDEGAYPSLPPSHFIKGNDEDFDVVARLAGKRAAAARRRFSPAPPPEEFLSPHLHLLPNGRLVEVDGIRVAGLGGTFAPTWYDTAAEELPSGSRARRTPRRASHSGPGLRTRRLARSDAEVLASGERDDKRRHFVRQEVEACAALREVDISSRTRRRAPYWAGTGRGRNDAGKAVINDVLAAMKPRLHVFGHHHRFSEAIREGVPSIGLPLVGDGYLVIDTEGWEWRKVENLDTPR